MKATSAVFVLGLGLTACRGRETPRASAPPEGSASDVRTAEVVRSGGSGEVAVPGAVRER